jgi:Bacterial SH3 domain
MINFNAKRQRVVASLFCLSLFLVVTVSCGAPVIGLARIVSAAETVVTFLDISEKTLDVVSSLVNTSYGTLGEDLKSENFRISSRLSNDIIENMETRHLELVEKHKELDTSLDKTNTAADNLFSMLETRANQNSTDSLRKEQLRDISVNKEKFSGKIKVAEDFSSKLEKSIKAYDDILNVFQVEVGIGKAQKYIEDVDSIISQYILLEQEVQVALHEGRQVVANVANIPVPSPEPTVSTPVIQNPKSIVLSPTLGSNPPKQQEEHFYIDLSEGTLTAKEAGAKINVYSGAGTNFKNLHYGLNGDKVILISSIRDKDNSTWYQIRFSTSGAEGWVHQDFIDVKE